MKMLSNSLTVSKSKLCLNLAFAIDINYRSASTTSEMDKIRARSLLKHTYVYEPPHDIVSKIFTMAKQIGFDLDPKKWKTESIADVKEKEKLFIDLGTTMKHFIPNSKLHKMKTFNDLIQFYSSPVNNVTKYAEMARTEELPKNVAILEHPRRFHPNDKSAVHEGVTATPGEGGKVFGIRNKRLYRGFKPKRDWFDYEDDTFNYDTDLTKGTPWDPEVARRMDSHADIRFTKEYLKKTG